MLYCCEDFAINHRFKLNPTKTWLLCFSCSPSSTCSACIHFCGKLLPFLGTVSHLGDLRCSFSDAEHINSKLRDMVRKADCLLGTYTFTRVGPFILTRLFQSY